MHSNDAAGARFALRRRLKFRSADTVGLNVFQSLVGAVELVMRLKAAASFFLLAALPYLDGTRAAGQVQDTVWEARPKVVSYRFIAANPF